MDIDMLTFAITTFFTLALIGALSVITMMFFGYREKITNVILSELQPDALLPTTEPTFYRYRTVKPRQMIKRNRPLHLAPLRVAA